MGQITLVVTSKVLERDSPERLMERQIAYRSATPDLAVLLDRANATNKVLIHLGGFMSLVVGDTGAIWRAHNRERLELFDALFELLGQRADGEMRFLCEP